MRQVLFSKELCYAWLMEQDFSKRFAIVVRSDLEPWQIMNTLAHIATKLGRGVEYLETGEKFITKDGFSIPRNSQYPIIVLRTKTSEEIRTLLHAIQETQLPYLAFIREMIDYTDDGELQSALNEKTASEAEYFGVGVFGDNETVKTLTKKFSLWK